MNTVEHDQPHIFAENDAAIYQAILGNGDMLLNYGDKFKVDILGYNSVRVNSGLVSVQGHIGVIEINDSQDITIENGVSGIVRKDLIVAQFTTTGNHGTDTFGLVVVKGAADGQRPEVTAEDLNKGGKTRQYPIAEVTMNGLSITEAKVIQTPATSMSDLLYALNERISYGTSQPSGGKDGDIYIMYR